MSFPPQPGSWVSFFADPASVALCLPVAGAKVFCGQVVETKEAPPLEPGGVPTCAVTVRGRTGKRVTVCFSSTYMRVHASKEEAIAETQRPLLVYDDKPATPHPARRTSAPKPHFGRRTPAPQSGG